MAKRKHAPAVASQRQDAEELLDRLAAANQQVQRDTECGQNTLRSWTHENLLSAMMASVPDFLFIKDREGRFVMANRGLPGRDITAEQLIGKTTWDVNLPDVAAKVRAQEQELFRSGEAQLDHELCFIDKKTGRKIWVRLSRIPLCDKSGEIVGLAGVARDITAQKLAEEEVKFLAHHDPLTRLPNRSLLIDRLEQAILRAKRSGSWVAVGFIDLDNFKLINDGLGHAAGDELLKVAANRMVNSLRATDTALRLGGDEFVMILAEQPKSIDAISAAVEKVREAISAPMELADRTIKTTFSMGLAIFPSDGEDADSLLKNADAAMYQAKTAGRDNFQFFTAEMNAKVHDRLSLQVELREAIANKQFRLAYQPQISLKSGKISAVEALVRWDHPRLGEIAPDEFIHLAEETGLIVPLGDWVLHEACRQNKEWQDQGLPPVRVCVNVSARQIREKNWIARVRDALDAARLEPCYLELELTESVIMQHVEQAVVTMRELQSIGVQLAIDDFGTGYSNLSALKTFPVARLKIDRSFVTNLSVNAQDRRLAKAVISLGRNLNMKVIAEGVETEAQLEFLTKNNCDEIQGYHFSKPIDSRRIANLLRTGEEPPAD